MVPRNVSETVYLAVGLMNDMAVSSSQKVSSSDDPRGDDVMRQLSSTKAAVV